ncbi:C40 family peptidase [Kitasatospora sp. NPDC006697]|uniref:C40 family peptidase n=1 Tax=Kitasatospora sp. NPDC006697 TaxID=3364020 RepID=UPI0036AB5C6A
MNPDLTSTAFPLTPPVSRATRLRHRVGLAAALVAGAGSIALGSGLALAIPAAAAPAVQPGLAPADDPDQDAGYAPGATDGTDDTAGTDETAAADDSSGYTAAEDTAENTAVDDGASDSGATDDSATAEDSTGTDASTAAPERQGWDGSVYWFRNGAGEWRYTSHRDIYLQRTGAAAPDASTAAAPSAPDTPSTPARPAARGSVETAVEFALAQLGKPFVMGGNGPDGYDCSGLIQQSFRRAGISLPRVANDQYEATTPVDSSRLRRGDLLFWSSDGTARGIHHGAIYLGDNRFVEAAKPGTTVRISHLNRGYWPSFTGRP